MQAFAPARSLYATAGFESCGPFGQYVESSYSTFMTLSLAGGLSGSHHGRHRDLKPRLHQQVEHRRGGIAVAPSVSVFADVFVKHATSPAGLAIDQAAAKLWELPALTPSS